MSEENKSKFIYLDKIGEEETPLNKIDHHTSDNDDEIDTWIEQPLQSKEPSQNDEPAHTHNTTDNEENKHDDDDDDEKRRLLENKTDQVTSDPTTTTGIQSQLQPFSTNKLRIIFSDEPNESIYSNRRKLSKNQGSFGSIKRSSSLNTKLNQFNNQRYTSNSRRIVINVGGTRFETYKTTLKLIMESRLAHLSPTNSDYDPIKMEYFFDRDPVSFGAILNYFRTGKLHVPNSICGNLFYEELNFWGIGERSILPCCWTVYSNKRECDDMLQKSMGDESDYSNDVLDEKIQKYSNFIYDTSNNTLAPHVKNRFFKLVKLKYSQMKPKIWRFLVDRNSSFSANIFFWISIVFLVISLINFVLETSSYFRYPNHISMNKSLTRREREQQTAPLPILTNIEFTCNIFFFVQYILKLVTAPNRIGYLKNPYNFLEFLAIFPLFWPAETLYNKHSWGVKVHNYIEVFYILRILRIFTLVPKYSGLRVLVLTLRNSIGELVLYMVMLFMTIMLFASFIFYAEQIIEEDDNKFDSVLIGLWWAIVTMTTLGYGDIVPVTPFGYIIGGMCALCGLIFMALPIPVIVNNFTTFYAHAKAKQKLKEYSEMQKNLPNKAVALQFIHPNNTFDLFSSRGLQNSDTTLFKIDNIDTKSSLTIQQPKESTLTDEKNSTRTDLNQTTVVEVETTTRCNPFSNKKKRKLVRRDGRDEHTLFNHKNRKRRNAISSQI